MPFLKDKFRIATALTLACICMWGCEYLGEEPKLVESGSRKGDGFAMVSDTTALLAVYYYELYEWSSGADRENCTKMGMRLVDTRGTEYNYWEGLVDSCRGRPHIEPIGDSIVLFKYVNDNNQLNYFIWKIKENPVQKKAAWVNGRLPIELNLSMRKWKEGKFLFKYYDKFALLDTAANTITQITKEEAGWPDDVNDAQYFGDDLMTIVLYPNKFSFSIVRNGLDTLSTFYEEPPNDYDERHERFNGRYINRMKEDGWYLYSTDSNWQISEKPVAKYYVQYFKSLDRE
ncbi:MAG: hypothetical protein IKN70_07650 [Fibrobacter sp.]|nr:hypothetical protein [Fibrobacter sp.]